MSGNGDIKSDDSSKTRTTVKPSLSGVLQAFRRLDAANDKIINGYKDKKHNGAAGPVTIAKTVN